MSRTVLISNKNIKPDISYNLTKTIFSHNDYLTNVLTHSTKELQKRHNYFEPIQLAFVNKNIPINSGARKYFKELEGEKAKDVYSMVLKEVELPLLQIVMEQCKDNQTLASQMLGLNRGTLRNKLKEYKLL